MKGIYKSPECGAKAIYFLYTNRKRQKNGFCEQCWEKMLRHESLERLDVDAECEFISDESFGFNTFLRADNFGRMIWMKCVFIDNQAMRKGCKQ